MVKTTPAHIRATAKYEAKAYDKVLLRLPKGTKQRIQDTGESINGFVNRLVMQELDRVEAENKDQA